jgi:hypothetical protein
MAAWQMDGKPRTARRFTVYKNCPLPTPEDRLFFVLTYLKGFVAKLHLRPFVLWSLPVTNSAQRGRATMAISFKGAHFPPDIILMQQFPESDHPE